jgi:primosomal protein N' (replication factor Y)
MLGTQMLVKGHDFPGVTLVVVILADGLFRWPDFRAPERAYQILKQVSGRAGRGERPGRVLIQTFDVDHPVLQVVQGTLPEETFLEAERELRQALGYPPFGRLARLRFESADAGEAKLHAEAVARALQGLESEGRIELLGPSEACLERAKGIHRWDLLIKSSEIQGLQKAVHAARELCHRQRWGYLVDVDPHSVS